MRKQKFRAGCRGIAAPLCSCRQRPLGRSQRQPKIMRDRRMGQQAAADIEAVAQMRVVGQGAPLVVTFSNRCLATKAIACWCLLDEAGHLCLIAQHFAEAGNWADIRCLDRTPPGGGQPLYAVIGRSLGVSPRGAND